MNPLDELEIHCPRIPHTTAQSLNLNAHNVLRRSTELANFYEDNSKMVRSDESQQESLELHKSGQLKPLLTKKHTGRSKKKMAKGGKEDDREKLLNKNSQQRSTEFTKRKSSGNKKLSSVSNDKDLTVDMQERVKLLKHQLKIKQEEVRYYRRHLAQAEKLAAQAQEKLKSNAFDSLQSIVHYIQNELDREASRVFPVIAKLVGVFSAFLEQPAHHHKSSNWSNLHTEAPLTPIAIDISTILKKDIGCLEQKLDLLKAQHRRLSGMTPPPSELIRRMRRLFEQQGSELTKLLQMEKVMEEREPQRNHLL